MNICPSLLRCQTVLTELIRIRIVLIGNSGNNGNQLPPRPVRLREKSIRRKLMMELRQQESVRTGQKQAVDLGAADDEHLAVPCQLQSLLGAGGP
ncbi:hypothetical protein D3C76_1636260 [compost metagenome]